MAQEDDKVKNDPDSDEYIDKETIDKLKKDGGKVSFEEMGKLIGQRWKNIDADRLTKYSDLAAEDTERYKKEMADYNGKQELKMRNEALKPSVPSYRSDKGQMQPAAYSDSSAYQGQMAYAYGGMDPYQMMGYYSGYGQDMGQGLARMDQASQYYMMGGGYQGQMMGYTYPDQGMQSGVDYGQPPAQGGQMDPNAYGSYPPPPGWGQSDMR